MALSICAPRRAGNAKPFEVFEMNPFAASERTGIAAAFDSTAFFAVTLGVAGQANIARAVTAQKQRAAKALFVVG